PAHPLGFTLGTPAAADASASQQLAFWRQLIDDLAAVPGVEHVGGTTHLPFSGQNMENGFAVEGFAAADRAEQPVAGMRGVTPDYFAALGVALRAGRAFTAADREGSMPV